MLPLTKIEVQNRVPKKLRNSITDSLVDKLNTAINDPNLSEQMKENFFSYMSVLQDGVYKIQDYVNAVIYVSFKLMGLSNRQAWERTFPDRLAALVASGKSERYIDMNVSMYHKNKLVNKIMEQSLVPFWVLNQDARQKAVNTCVEIMQGGRNELARVKAADTLLNYLQEPKEMGPLISIDARETSGFKELQNLLSDLASKQLEAIKNGVSAKEIAEQSLIEANHEKETVS